MALAPFADRTLGLVLRDQVALRQRDDLRQSVEPARRSAGQLRAHRYVGLTRDLPRTPPRSTRWTSSRQRSSGRGTRGRARRPRRRPRSGRGCRPAPAGGRPASIAPRIGLEGGERVVGDLRLARVNRASSDDLPALGSPTRPTSASSFRRSSIQPVSPSQPPLGETRRLAGRGREALVPWPPEPPRATTSPLAAASSSYAEPSSPSTTVPGGTGTTRVLAALARGAGCPSRGRRGRRGSAARTAARRGRGARRRRPARRRRRGHRRRHRARRAARAPRGES